MTRPNCSKSGLCYPLDNAIRFPNSYQLVKSTIQLWNNWGAVLYSFAVVVTLFSTSL